MPPTLANHRLRLGVVSDLHLDHEFSLPSSKLTDLDVFIVAGDFCNGVNKPATGVNNATAKYLRAAPKPCLVVLGNHDYYNSSINLPDVLKDASRLETALETVPGVTVLRDGVTFDKGGYTFIGCTMWSTLSWTPPGYVLSQLEYGVHNFVLDSKAIYPFENFCRRMVAAGKREETYLRQAVKAAVNRNQIPIVVTHFAPSRRSEAERYRGHPLNPYFLNNLQDDDELFQSVKLWIHGHTHVSFDYIIGKCRVVCNPRGYNKRENKNYRSSKIIVVDSDSWTIFNEG